MESNIIWNEHSHKEENRFIWKIQKFASLKKLDKIFCSFKMGLKIGLPYDCEWICYLIRSGCSSNHFNQVQIELLNCPPSIKQIKATFFAGIYNPIKKVEYSGSGYSQSDMAIDKWTSAGIILNSTSAPINKDGSLEIEIFCILCSPIYNTLDEILSKFSAMFTKNLQSSMANMLNLPPLPGADMPAVIVCQVDNVKLPVQRGVLAARSVVFMAMFSSEMTEKNSGQVEVADVSSDVMKIILHFLYTGTLLPSWKAVKAALLLYAAAKYEVNDLLQFLDVVIGRICTTDNSGNLLNLARKLNLKRAENDLFNYIKNSSETFNQVEKFVNDVNSDKVFGLVRRKM